MFVLHNVKLAIISPVPVEHAAILARLHNLGEQLKEGNRYVTGGFEGKYHRYEVVTQLTGSKNEVLADATGRVVRLFEPAVVILAGIAGGVKDVQVGDVVVGTKYYGYESGKVTPEGFAARPDSGYYSKELIAVAQSAAGDDQWRRRAQRADRARVWLGAIAAGNKVIGSSNSEIFRLLKQHYNDTLALEMEAAGFGSAMLNYPAVRFLNIRGISDLLDGKSASDAAGSQELAADNMAAFIFELLYRLDITQFNTTGMDIKELAKQVIALILPIIKMDAVKEIGNDFKDATNGTIRELWQKAKPLFIEEYDTLKNNPDDSEARGAAANELKNALKDKPALQQELEALVESARKSQGGATTIIENSKNVISGSNISVGGDFHLGDKGSQSYNDTGLIAKDGDVNQSGKYVAGRDININK